MKTEKTFLRPFRKAVPQPPRTASAEQWQEYVDELGWSLEHIGESIYLQARICRGISESQDVPSAARYAMTIQADELEDLSRRLGVLLGPKKRVEEREGINA